MMDWHASMVIKHGGGACRIGVLLVVLLVSPTLGAPLGGSADLDSDGVETKSASAVEVLRNMEKILKITKPFEIKKVVKQAAETAESEGAANALAYLTDSFGGQLAGQILSVILSSVTGDVRGILGGSLNLFQTDERRDRVQTFLDDVSQNFLKITGLGALTTTKPPPGLATSAPILLGAGNRIQAIRPNQVLGYPAVASLGSTSALSGGGFGGFGAGSYAGLTGNTGTSLSLAQLQQPKPQGSGSSQPIIYVLPGLGPSNSAASTSSGTTGSKVITVNKGSTSSASASVDDDSEEDRKR